MSTATQSLRIRPVDGRGRPMQLGHEPISIGRHPSNTLPITDDRASRKHCVIEPGPSGGFLVRDLDSRNGTKVNGLQISEAVLGVGDVIAIGKTEFVIEPGVTARSHPQVDSTAATDLGHSAEGSRSSARADRSGKGEDAGGGDDSFSVDLYRVLEGLPPRNEEPPTVAIIQADGTPSQALESEGPGSMATRLLIQVASKSRATDVHMEPKTDITQVRMRVDGQMVWIADLPRAVGDRVNGLIKTACHMKTAHTEAVLDGHFSARIGERRVEFRVSFTPSMHGQKLVIRVLDMRGVPTSLHEMGLLGYMEDRVRKVCEKDSGILLTVGPTGSGKTTTLYNCLRSVDRERRNVITIEDPIEYQLEGVTQIPINAQRGNSFGSLLRSVLRQDPDVILVGEIRDEETARTAMQAAMTGHVVFSTLHAKDSISAIFRLLDLGIEPYLVANALDLVLAQRLVRVLCDRCSREVPVSPGQASRIGQFLKGKTVAYVPVGCTACLSTGFRGRQALFELLEFSDGLRDIVLGEPTVAAMKRVIASGHFTTLAEFGWRLVADGVTSIEEIERVADV